MLVLWRVIRTIVTVIIVTVVMMGVVGVTIAVQELTKHWCMC